ncbi:MAG: transcription antitermination factor NusB [Longimicrobiaceae bacterium]
MKNRSRARGWALQALYAWETRGADPSGAAETFQELARERNISPKNRGYADALLRLYQTRAGEIDQTLGGLLINWRLGRLATIDRNVLRLAATEMLYMDDVPELVTIREFVRLAERYGTLESPSFVNGVLDALMRQTLSGAVPADP